MTCMLHHANAEKANAPSSSSGPMGTSYVKYKPPPPRAKPDAGTKWIPRAVNAVEAKRHKYNDSVKAAALAAKGRRYAFLGRHIDVLTPFITPTVRATIKCAPLRLCIGCMYWRCMHALAVYSPPMHKAHTGEA